MVVSILLVLVKKSSCTARRIEQNFNMEYNKAYDVVQTPNVAYGSSHPHAVIPTEYEIFEPEYI
jgi:hypothetical protein